MALSLATTSPTGKKSNVVFHFPESRGKILVPTTYSVFRCAWPDGAESSEWEDEERFILVASARLFFSRCGSKMSVWICVSQCDSHLQSPDCPLGVTLWNSAKRADLLLNMHSYLLIWDLMFHFMAVLLLTLLQETLNREDPADPLWNLAFACCPEREAAQVF